MQDLIRLAVTRAKKKVDGGYKLSGTKMWISIRRSRMFFVVWGKLKIYIDVVVVLFWKKAGGERTK